MVTPRFWRRRLGGQCQGKAADLTLGAGKCDGTAHEADHLVDVGEAEADAFVAAGETTVGLDEGAEDVLALVGGDADAGVPDDEIDGMGRGAEVRLMLPLTALRAEETVEPTTPAVRTHAALHILVVEDEARIRDSLSRKMDTGVPNQGQILI